MSHIGINELIFNKDEENGIYSGGFSVNSIMLKNGISPITTINVQKGGTTNQVSDLFNDLVVPNWLLSLPYKFSGGGFNKGYDENYEDECESNKSSEDEIIDEDLHDKLLELASVSLKNKKKTKRMKLKTNKKITRKNRIKS